MTVLEQEAYGVLVRFTLNNYVSGGRASGGIVEALGGAPLSQYNPNRDPSSYDRSYGIEASYSLIAYASYEGMDVHIEGTHGRLDLHLRLNTSWAVGRKDADANDEGMANDGENSEDIDSLKFYKPDGEMEELTQQKAEGGHGASDPALRKMLFGPEEIPDPLGQKAELEEGIQAVLVGIATNKSVELVGKPINPQTMEIL